MSAQIEKRYNDREKEEKEKGCRSFLLGVATSVVYFDKHLGAVHFKCCLK